MKKIIAIMIAIIFSSAYSFDIATKNGTTYKECSVDKPTPYGLSIIHKGGIATIPYKELPDDIREKYKKEELSAPDKIEKIENAKKELGAAASEKAQLDSVYAVIYCKYAKISSVDSSKNAIFVENNIPTFYPQTSGSYSGFAVAANRGASEDNRVFPEKCIFSELLFLSGADFSNCIDGQSLEKFATTKNGLIVVECWRIGTISYITTIGSTKTIPHYTADKSKAIRYYKKLSDKKTR